MKPEPQMPFMMRFKHWLGQTTTLQGLAVLVAATIGLFTAALPDDLGLSLIGGAVVLLFPENPSLRLFAQAMAPVAARSLHRAGHSLGVDNQGLPGQAPPFSPNNKE
ncbi:hypothetical protein E3E12_06100 [Formicincola oecophyllae]|uniref:Uncharacterized protein n=1 Tax=Formicincola oecophyllae TaxID=2558361 RepID=A0A4Y6UBI4_9PROT|nr:hypothetical protein [Formicincola oecophyllae]QDH13827.1 hypothetical protein E3E12_06100 [Formicincola oecophyllae]